MARAHGRIGLREQHAFYYTAEREERTGVCFHPVRVVTTKEFAANERP